MLSVVIGLMLLPWEMPSPSAARVLAGSFSLLIQLMTDKYSSLQQLRAAPKMFPSVCQTRIGNAYQLIFGDGGKTMRGDIRKPRLWAMGFLKKIASWATLAPAPRSQAVGPEMVTQEGMPVTSDRHARELLSTCQQVTSYGNQTPANLRTLCVTAYLDLGLSSRSLSFTFARA